MEKVRIIKKKYDGSLCDEHETYLLAETDDMITLSSLSTLSYWDYRKAAWFHAPDGLLEIYFKRKWYNVWHIAEQNSHINLTYVNIAMPAVLRGDTLDWVDLDLDYRVHIDNTVELVDEEEYKLNKLRLSYPPEIIKQAQAACLEVEAGLKERHFAFDYERQVALYYQIKNDLQSK
jgi:uncharacterized protein